MRLVSADVGPFKSISTAQTVKLDQISVFVGMNEAGKTVFLQALQKSRDVLGLAKFDPVDDYPRRHLPTYLKEHKDQQGADVTTLTYELSPEEVAALNDELHTEVKEGFTFTVTHRYDNGSSIGIHINEQPILAHLLANSGLSSDAMSAARKADSLRQLPDVLRSVSLTDTDQVFLAIIEARIAPATWDALGKWEAWQWLSPRIPAFMYFGDYDVLPSKTNLAELANRVAAAVADPKQLTSEHRGVLALLRMADIDIEDFAKPGGV